MQADASTYLSLSGRHIGTHGRWNYTRATLRYPIRSTLKHSISDPSDISRVREPARNNGVQLPARHVSTRIRRNRERAAAASAAARRGTVGTNPALRTVPTEGSGYAGVRRHGNRRPASDKGQNEWRTVSAHARDGRNPQWDRTVSDPA